MKHVFTVLASGLLMLAAAASHAHGYRIGDLRIEHPWAETTGAGQVSSAAYFVVTHAGDTPDRLIAARPHPDFAASVELYDSGEVEGGASGAITIMPGGETVLSPEGARIALHGLTGPLSEGDLHAMTLVFERAGEIEVAFYVQPAPEGGGTHRH